MKATEPVQKVGAETTAEETEPEEKGEEIEPEERKK